MQRVPGHVETTAPAGRPGPTQKAANSPNEQDHQRPHCERVTDPGGWSLSAPFVLFDQHPRISDVLRSRDVAGVIGNEEQDEVADVFWLEPRDVQKVHTGE